VGFADNDGYRVPFEVKRPKLMDDIETQLAQSEQLQCRIRMNLGKLNTSDSSAENFY
jgi:redox-regulated HSP33 family molecular chaperone